MKYTKYLAILAAAFMMGSCSDDFLDKEPSENASEGRTEIIRYFQLRLRSLPIVRLGGSVRIATESGTPLFLPVPVGVNARIAVGTYSRKGLTICRQHTLKLLRSGRRRTCH